MVAFKKPIPFGVKETTKVITEQIITASAIPLIVPNTAPKVLLTRPTKLKENNLFKNFIMNLHQKTGRNFDAILLRNAFIKSILNE